MNWYTEHHDNGTMIVCIAHGLGFSYLLNTEQMKMAHDPAFLFWQAIGAITRSVREYGKYLEGGV
ncbi:hypothetical protein [Leptolyngbya phage Lbo-JY16]